ncbi:MAG: hypothetical protein FJ297_02630 [Planctomycetes bacterium]|nr:hypothetical protein [Planctomycetota bacterium]
MRRRTVRGIGSRFARRLAEFVVFAACSAVAVPVLACPNCRDMLGAGDNGLNLMRGYFWSILFMMSAPFAILGGLSAYFYWEVCRARRTAALSASADAVAELRA